MTPPLPFGTVEFPELPVRVAATAVVRDGTSVALRLATTLGDNLLTGPGSFLAARNNNPDNFGGITGNWQLHVPPEVFVEMVSTQMGDILKSLPGGVSIEDPLTVGWGPQPDFGWGVSAAVGLVKEDACPGLFGSVDISVSVELYASFATRTDTSNHLDVQMITVTNASDWDTFRCWLGSGAVISGLITIVNPFLGFGVGVSSLVMIGDLVGQGASEPLHRKTSVGPLRKVVDTEHGAIYSQSIDLPTHLVRGAGREEAMVTSWGLDLVGTAMLFPLSHVVSFVPEGGNISGVNYSSRVDCSHRALDWSFTFAPVIVTDTVTALDQPIEKIPVGVWMTTTSDPLGNGVSLVDETRSGGSTVIAVRGGSNIYGPRMRPGDEGWIVLHTTAGVLLYTLGPVPGPPPHVDTQRLIDKFCDAKHELSTVIDIPELRFTAPEPEFDFGFEALRQWQFVLADLREGNEVVVATDRGNSSPRRV